VSAEKNGERGAGRPVRPRLGGVFLLGAASGLLSAASFPPLSDLAPAGLFNWLIFVSLAPIVFVAGRCGPLWGALAGFTGGFVGCGIAFHWVLPLVPRFTNLNWAVGVAAFSAYLLGEALFWAALGWIWALEVPGIAGWLWRVGSPVVLEAFWPRIFPWHFGDPCVELPLVAQVADLGGVAVVSALVLAVNLAFERAVLGARKGFRSQAFLRPAAFGLFLLGATFFYGALRLQGRPQAEGTVSVAVVHPAVSLARKHRASLRIEDFLKLRDYVIKLAASSFRNGRKPDLVVIPEALFSVLKGHERIGLYRALKVPVLFGAGYGVPAEKRQYNSVVLFDGRSVQLYHKHHLVPFGESVPFSEWFPFLETWIGVRSQGRGPGPVVLKLGKARIAPLICYEAILGRYVRKFVALGANIIINVTEDGWYGWTGEPRQHLMLARFRSIETRRYLVRTVNNGISAVIDPWGRIVKSVAKPKEPSAFVCYVPLLSGTTPYVRWGEWFLWAMALLSVGGLLSTRIRNRRPRGRPTMAQ